MWKLPTSWRNSTTGVVQTNDDQRYAELLNKDFVMDDALIKAHLLRSRGVAAHRLGLENVER